MSKSSPVENSSTFRIGAPANADVLAIARLCARLGEYEYTAQRAIWAAAGDASYNEIDGIDSGHVMTLRHSVAKLRPSLAVAPFQNTYRMRAAITTKQELAFHTGGTEIIRNVKASDTVSYAVYNQSDSVIYNFAPQLAVLGNSGTYCKVSYDIEANGLDPKQKYFLRFKVNGVVRKEYLFDYWL
jgi:hypothetical protein